jgi:hypothetical protein
LNQRTAEVSVRLRHHAFPGFGPLQPLHHERMIKEEYLVSL